MDAILHKTMVLMPCWLHEIRLQFQEARHADTAKTPVVNVGRIVKVHTNEHMSERRGNIVRGHPAHAPDKP